MKNVLATDVEGIFRLSGSAKRIKELQVIFDSPDRYGKGLDWTGYTVHDAANILRRYLNQLPQPIVPLDFYERCRDPLRSHQAQAVGDMDAQAQDVGEFDADAAITTYQKLITELPPLNRQLLLYILDLLAVFSSKSELNRMTSANLSAIFQPGLLSHPNHDMSPQEYRLSQDVLIFLIENQDSFLVGMSGTAADEKTVKEVQSGGQRQPNTPTKPSQAGLGRSASNASAGADSLRKAGGVRRNVSVSSKNSKASSNVPSPGSPAPGSPFANANSSNGVQRSNTLPSKKSPGIPSSRLGKPSGDPPTPTSSKLAPGGFLTPAPQATSPGSKVAHASSEASSFSGAPIVTPTTENSSGLTTVPESNSSTVGREAPSGENVALQPPEQGVATANSAGTPTRERKAFFSKSPSSDTERKERQPNKLKKKTRAPDTSKNASAHSSTHSLHGALESPTGQAFHTPAPTPKVGTQVHGDALSSVPPELFNTEATPPSDTPPRLGEIDKMSSFHGSRTEMSPAPSPALMPAKSPIPSLHSKTSATEDSELDPTNDEASKDNRKRRSRWRLSSSAKKQNEPLTGTPAGSRLGSSTIAETSATSVVSAGRQEKSTTNDSQPTTTGTEVSIPSGLHTSSNESTPLKEKEAVRGRDLVSEEKEKKGPIGWFKAKVAHAKEERKEREAEKERAKSPPRTDNEHALSRQSLGAIAHEGSLTAGPTTEAKEEGSQGKEVEQDVPAAAHEG